MQKMVQVTFRIGYHGAKRLEEKAKKEFTTVSSIIRAAIAKYLGK